MSAHGGGTTSVEVALRIKPLTPEDLEKLPTRFQRQVISTSDIPGQVIVDADKRSVFQFDHVFGPDASQEVIYESAVLNLLEKFLEGYNVTILAYGQTSSGKTYTMGTADNESVPLESKGIIPRTMATLFELINSQSDKFVVTVSFIEIYNEDLIDLLGEGNLEERPLVQIREDSKGNIYWMGLREMRVTNVHEVMEHLSRGSLNRQKFLSHSSVGPPATPPPGSRPGTPKYSSRPPSRATSALGKTDDGEWVTINSKFHFVDLAGSERLKRTAASGDRAKEGISINSGLLALANVISALGDQNTAKHSTHVPYRDSKLTRLLQDSLGGNAQTLMIACVSPAEFNLTETTNTLKYAHRARNIKNTAKVNQEESGWNDVGHLQGLVLKLRTEVSSLKATIASGHQFQSSGSVTPGRVTPTTPTTSTFSGGIKLPGRSTPTGRNTPTSGIPGRSTPTSGIPGRSTPTSGIPVPGRSTPTSGIPVPGRITPASGIPIPGRIAQTSGIPVPGRNALTPGIPTRNAPSGLSNGKDAHIRRRPSSPLTSFSNGANSQLHKEKEVETLEEEILYLQQSYAELSQRYARISAELAMHQDNYDGMENLKNEPLTEEYKDRMSELEDKLTDVSRALIQSESSLKEREIQLKNLEEQNSAIVINLESKIKDLESKLQKQEIEARIKTTRDNSPESFISETVKLLEKRLEEREADYEKLEAEYKRVGAGEIKTQSTDEKSRGFVEVVEHAEADSATASARHEIVEKELSELRKVHSSTVEQLNELKAKQQEHIDQIEELKLQREIRNTDGNDSSVVEMETKLEESKREHEKTMAELREITTRYQDCLQRVQDLELQAEGYVHHKAINELHSISSTPITPMTPGTPYNEQHKNTNFNTASPYRPTIHRKSKSLSVDLVGAEKRDVVHSSIVEKLQFELQLFESFHKDKTESLNNVKDELEKLEKNHYETLLVVDELREEIKRRDSEAKKGTLAHEVESQSRESQKVTDPELDNGIGRENVDTAQKAYERRINELEEELTNLKSGPSADSRDGEEITMLEEVTKLQAKIEELITLRDEHENTIKRLENELKTTRETQLTISQERNGGPVAAAESAVNDPITSYVIATDEGSSADKLEQNVDENVMALEDTVKSLEAQLTKVQESNNVQLQILSPSEDIFDHSQKTVDTLLSQLSYLRQEFSNASKESQILNNSKDLTYTLQSQLESIRSDVQHKNELIELLKQGMLDQTSLQTELKEKKTVIAELTKQLEEVKCLNVEIQKQIQSLQAQVDPEELKSLREELTVLKETGSEQQKTISQLQGQLRETKDTKDSILDQLEEMKGNLRAQTNLVSTLESNLQTAMEELNLTRKNHVASEGQIKELTNILSATVEQRNEFENKVQSLENEIKELTSKRTHEAEDFELLQEQLMSTKRAMDERNQLFVELESKLKEMEQEKDGYSELNEELDKMIAEKDVRHEEAVNVFRVTIRNLQEELEEAKRSAQMHQESMSSLSEKLVAVSSHLEEVRASDERKSLALKEVDTTLSEKEQLVIEKDAFVAELKATLQSVQEENISMMALESARVKELQDQLDEFEKKLQSAPTIEELNIVKSSAVRKENLVRELEKKIEEMEQNKSAELEELYSNIDKLINELEEAKAQGSAQSGSVKELEDTLAEKESRLSELNTSLNEMQTQLSQMKETEVEHAELIQALESELQNVQNSLNDEVSKLSIANKEVETLKERCEVLQNEVETTKNEMTIKDSAANESHKLLEGIQIQLLQAQKELEIHQANVEELRKKTNQLENERDIHTSTNQELEEQIRKLQEELESLAVEFTDVSTRYEDMEIRLEEKTNRINELESSLEEIIKIEANDIERSVDHNDLQRDESIKSLQAKIAELERRPTEEYMKSLEVNPDEITELNKKIAELEQKTSEKSELIGDLENMMKGNNESLEGAKQQLEILRQEKSDLQKQTEILRVQLKEAQTNYDKFRLTVEEEKKEMETALEKERKEKRRVEAAFSQLESQFEQLQLSRKKRFACF
ncbi:13777_t:CDS:2 [Acaulospora colombiana]|uniref:13777_t:CDS:1 n=1 Tax=Acaulospora colombiana TaxID=27376 RepID=A0ACA9KRC9_9GLOM|nr:13777_t:CDS:2 [Acaulospora colombiana]